MAFRIILLWLAVATAAGTAFAPDDTRRGALAAQPAADDDLLKQHRDRMQLEEQRTFVAVERALREVRRTHRHDPDAAFVLLRETRLRILDHPDLGERTRLILLRQLTRARLELFPPE